MKYSKGQMNSIRGSNDKLKKLELMSSCLSNRVLINLHPQQMISSPVHRNEEKCPMNSVARRPLFTNVPINTSNEGVD